MQPLFSLSDPPLCTPELSMRAQGSGDNSSSCRTDLSQHGWLCTWPKRILSTSRSTAVLWSDEDKRGVGRRGLSSTAREIRPFPPPPSFSLYSTPPPVVACLTLSHTQKAAGLRMSDAGKSPRSFTVIVGAPACDHQSICP